MSTSKTIPEPFTLKDHLVEYAWMIGLSPLWVPMWLIYTVVLHCRLFWCLRGNMQSAWDRCVKIWASAENAYGAEVGAAMTTPFAHSLAVHFSWYHWRARDFLTDQLRNSNPYLAAYAFKCLIRCGPITVDDIPADVLARTETITATRFGCIGESMTISKYIRDYFQTTQYLESQKTT